MTKHMKRNSLLAVVLLLLLAALPAFGQDQPKAACDFPEKRVNNRPHRDCSAPLQIFMDNGVITLLTPRIGITPGQAILEVSSTGPIPTTANQIIAEAINPHTGRPVFVSRLTTGEFQLNTFYGDGSGYIIVWYGGANDAYHIDPVTGQILDNAQPIVVPGATNPSAGAANAPVVPATTTTTTTTVTTPDSLNLSGCRATTTRMVRLRTEPNTVSEIITVLPYRWGIF